MDLALEVHKNQIIQELKPLEHSYHRAFITEQPVDCTHRII